MKLAASVTELVTHIKVALTSAFTGLSRPRLHRRGRGDDRRPPARSFCHHACELRRRSAIEATYQSGFADLGARIAKVPP